MALSDVEFAHTSLQALIRSFFSPQTVASSAAQFDEIMTVYASPGNNFGASPSHHVQILNAVMALLFFALAEHGHHNLRWGSANQNLSLLCSDTGSLLPGWCKLTQHNRSPQKWLQSALYLVQALHANKLPSLTSTSITLVRVHDVSEEFCRDAMLLLLAYSYFRLSTIIRLESSDRWDAEACLLTVIIFIHYHHILFVKRGGGKQGEWKLLAQRTDAQLSPDVLFVKLRLQSPDLRTYFHQDLISMSYDCITKAFIDAQIKLLINPIGQPDLKNAMTCVTNLSMNSFTVRASRTFRSMWDNKFVAAAEQATNIVFNVLYYIGLTVGSLATSLYQSTRHAARIGSWVYDDRWPRLTGAASVVVGLVAFSTHVVYTHPVIDLTKFALGGLKNVAAKCFGMSTLELAQLVPTLEFDMPGSPAFLVLERSADGRYSTVYAVCPLPKPRGVFNYRGGSIHRGGGRSDVAQLVAVMERGFYKDVPPLEIQEYIKDKLALGAHVYKKGGGAAAADETRSALEEFNKAEPLSPGFIREIVDVANTKSFLGKNDQEGTVNLVIPMPQLQKEALENAPLIAVEDPSSGVLPESIPSEKVPEREAVDQIEQDTKNNATPLAAVVPENQPGQEELPPSPYVKPAFRSYTPLIPVVKGRTRRRTSPRKSRSRSRSRSRRRVRSRSRSRPKSKSRSRSRTKAKRGRRLNRSR